jgi:hypothetical protein
MKTHGKEGSREKLKKFFKVSNSKMSSGISKNSVLIIFKEVQKIY